MAALKVGFIVRSASGWRLGGRCCKVSGIGVPDIFIKQALRMSNAQNVDWIQRALLQKSGCFGKKIKKLLANRN